MRKISKPKEIPYHIFWASKGEYGKERLRRFKERLDERMFRKSHVCPKCRNSHKATSPTYCPYDEDVNNTLTLCHCCDSCRYECAMDI